MGRLDRLVVLVLFLAAAWALFGERDGAPKSRRPSIEPGARPGHHTTPQVPTTPMPPRSAEMAIPPPSLNDPVFRVEVDRRSGVSIGTAFSIDAEGIWLTARHVTDGCSQVGLRGRNGWVRATTAWMHPRADLAVLRTQGGAAAFTLSSDTLVLGQDGFGMGFPQGKPGAVHGRLIGRSQMQAEGRFNGRAPTLSWAEQRRQPNFEGTLGGISGGPMLDARGNIIGVMVAESPRRGRFETLAPEVLTSLTTPDRALRRAPQGSTAVTVLRDNFGRSADGLRERLQITQAVCQTR